MSIVLAWSLTGLAVAAVATLLALGIELNRRDYGAREPANATADVDAARACGA